MKIINLTPHKVCIYDECEVITHTFESQGVARVNVEQGIFDEINGIDVCRTMYSDTVGLPDIQKDTFYIVSIIVMQNNPSRYDLICQDTSPTSTVRDNDGRIMGVKRFMVI